LRRTSILLLILTFGLSTFLVGQDRPVNSINSIDSLQNPIDTIPIDTIPTDTFKLSSDTLETSKSVPQKITVKISPDSPDEPVEYNAKDSMDYDIKNKKVYLYGEAVVTQNTMTLTAERIIIDFGNNEVTAEGIKDSRGNPKGNPTFEEGEQNFTSGKMKYNFKSKKGKIFDAVTEEGDLFIHGSQSKFIQGEKSPGDTTSNDIIYNLGCTFTTCNHPVPHFGIRAKKVKMIPGEVAVVGPANIVLGGVPTPLAIPFGFFPLKQGARTGLIFPRDYEFSQEWGFGLRNVGWYFPINNNWDTKVLADVYFKRTWGLTVDTRYKYRYKSSGSFNIAYSDRKREQSDANIISERSVRIQWSHNQDRSAHPYRSFSSSVNIQTNGFQSRNFNDSRSVLDNTLNSSISYRRSFPGRPINLTANMSHSQNTRTNRVTFNLPTLGLSMNRIYPFENKNRVGEEKWYERISFKYDLDAQNRFTTTDTTILSKQTLESAQFGMRHRMSTDLNFKVLKYINVSPNINYTDVWYGNEIERRFNNEIQQRIDTIFNPDGTILQVDTTITSFGELEDEKINGFSRYFQLSTGVNANTTLFYTKLFKKGLIRGIRHVAKPRIGINFSPDYTNPEFGYYKDVIIEETPLNETPDTIQYSVFQDGVYGSPGNGGRQMRFTYGIRNNFEAKYYSRRDSSDKKLKLFDNIDVSGDYNFAKDTLKWSDVSVGGNTRLFGGLTNVIVNARWSPYALDENRNPINTFYWNTNKKLLRFVTTNVRTSTNFTVKQIRELFTGKKESSNRPSTTTGGRGGGTPSTSQPVGDIGLFEMFDDFRISYNFNLVFEPSRLTGNDSLIVSSHAIETRGTIDLTENWKVTIGRIGYDFKNKRVTFPDFSFYRNLHCWEMGMSWQPELTTYSFFLRVKPSSLDFIELPYQKNNADARFGGF